MSDIAPVSQHFVRTTSTAPDHALENSSLLKDQLQSLQSTSTPLLHAKNRWLPLRPLSWLASYFTSNAQPKQQSEMRELQELQDGRAIRLDIEAMETCTVPERPSSLWSGLLITAISLVASAGAYASYKFANSMRQGKSGDTTWPGTNRNHSVAMLPPSVQASLENKRNTGERFIAERRINTYVPGPPPVWQEPQGAPSQSAEKKDEVLIRKLVVLDCLKVRNNMGVADWFRAIGNALVEPIDSLSKEVLVVHKYNTLGNGCPTEEEFSALEKITKPLDYAVGAIISVIPYMVPYIVLQSVVGPLLRIIADYAEGKKIDLEDMNKIAIQIMQITKDIGLTLPQNERALLHNTPEGKDRYQSSPPNLVSLRFAFKNNKFHINVKGEEYPYEEVYGPTPHVFDKYENKRYVNFNQHRKRWEYSDHADNVLYSADNLKNIEEFGTPFSQIPEGFTIRPAEHGLLKIITPNKLELTGLLMGDRFVPVKYEWRRSDAIVTTDQFYQTESRVIIRNEYGWYFEPPSINMDDNLALVLASKDIGISNPNENVIGPINEFAGLSMDGLSNFYIKKNNKYYKVKPDMVEINGKGYYALENYNNALVEYDYDYEMFKLHRDDNFIFALRNTKEVDALDSTEVFNIETDAADFLSTHAKKSATMPKNRIRPGLYLDSNNNAVFKSNQEIYAVSKYSDDGQYVYIEGSGDNQQTHNDEIVLWSDDNTWVRIRKESNKEPYEYSEITACRTARSPGATGKCLPVMIEKEIEERLKYYINNNLTNNGLKEPNKLVMVKQYDAPILYIDPDSMKYYFHFQGSYFDTKIIQPHENNYHTNLPCLTITGKGNFLSSEEFIDNIVIVKKEDRIEIKSMEAYFAETLNVRKDVASLYLKNRFWRSLPEISTIETLVNEARGSGEIYVDIPRRFSRDSTTDELRYIKRTLFPSHIVDSNSYNFKIVGLNNVKTERSLYIKGAQESISKEAAIIRDKILPVTINSIDEMSAFWTQINNYISDVLNVYTEELQDKFAAAIRKRLKRARADFDMDKIFLVSTSPESEAGHFSSALSREEMAAGKAIVMIPENGNIYVNLDKFFTEANTAMIKERDFITEFLQALFHTRDMTSDFYTTSKKNGISIPINNSIKDLQQKLALQKFSPIESSKLKEVSKTYLQNVKAYTSHIEDILSERDLAYLADNDPAYLAHLMLTSPDFLTLITEDLFYLCMAPHFNQSIAKRIDWVIKYGEQRGVSFNPDMTMEIQSVRPNMKPYIVTDMLTINKKFDGESLLNEARKLPQIDKAIAAPLDKSEFIMGTVAYFMKAHGFKHIRYRGMALFSNTLDCLPIRQFAVTGTLKNQQYVFDLAAGQLSEKFYGMNRPIILEEEEWAKLYANLDEDTLVKYGDYPTQVQALRYFGQESRYLSHGPNVYMPDVTALNQPEWYFSEPNTLQRLLTMMGRRQSNQKGFFNPIRDAARASRFVPETGDQWDYAVNLLVDAQFVEHAPAEELRTKLKQAANILPSTSSTSTIMEGLFTHVREIHSEEEILRVKMGEILLFVESTPGTAANNVRPFHMMVCAGNGRFAGINNNVLHAALGDGKKIITAEQLGNFVKGKFILSDNKFTSGNGKHHIGTRLIAASPASTIMPSEDNLKFIAEHTPSSLSGEGNIVDKITWLLRNSGEMAPEQSVALQEILSPRFAANAEASTVSGRSLESLYTSSSKITSDYDLASLPKGKLVLISKPNARFAVEHLMYSLGEGEFVMLEPEQLDHRLESRNAIIKADQFPEETFRNHRIIAGDVSLSELRSLSLLGVDSQFIVEGKSVTVKVHGTDGNVAYMDPFELAEVIRGIGLREKTKINWANVEYLELASCWGAAGKISTGKMLASLLNVKVKAWPGFYESGFSTNPLKARTKTFRPGELTADDMKNWQEINQRSESLWQNLRTRFSGPRRNRYERDSNQFDSLLDSVADLAHGDIGIKEFFRDLPDYQSQLYLTEVDLSTLISKRPSDADAFAERCMDIIHFSKYSADLLDDYLDE
ncbi:hypothetical protein ACQYRI_09310 [Salmonella enterica]